MENLAVVDGDPDVVTKKYVDDAVAAGGGGGGTDTVFVQPGQPTGTTWELWVDTDDPAGEAISFPDGGTISEDVNSDLVVAPGGSADVVLDGDVRISGVASQDTEPVGTTDLTTKQYVDAGDSRLPFAIEVPVGTYLGSPWNAGGTSTAGTYGSTTANAALVGFFYPFMVRRAMTFSHWWVSVTTAATDAGSTIAAAVYSQDEASGWPKDLLSDLGTTSATTTGARDVTIAPSGLYLAPGIYFVCHKWRTATTAGTNPVFHGNALTSLFVSAMFTGSTPHIPYLAMTANQSWPSDATSLVTFSWAQAANIPRIGLKRSA